MHILASISVIGPTFVVPVIRRSARTAGQLRFALDVTQKLALLPRVGGAVLIITGVWLMIISQLGLSQMWLNLSLLLSLLMVAAIDGLIEPRMKQIKQLASIQQGAGDEIPDELGRLMRKLVPVETVSQLLMLVILVLMVLKPF
ncbi:DUF2269 family protein [Paenibacillus sp. 1P07SE]|uniref:DUF2269 family protein n=1 Tax=Paenibacillus sp. 1P07SE TaxID=3132209 RepID=UPI0039A55B1E